MSMRRLHNPNGIATMPVDDTPLATWVPIILVPCSGGCGMGWPAWMLWQENPALCFPCAVAAGLASLDK